MNLSTKGRYGARFMVDLAIHGANGSVPLKDVAQRQSISEKYLWNLIGPLKTTGLIRSERGAYGGFVVARPLSEITMKDVIGALEGSMYIVDCIDSRDCQRSQDCVTHALWRDVSESIIQTLESVTLEDMVNRQKAKWELAAEEVPVYSI